MRMRCEHGDRTYDIKFRHEDNRFRIAYRQTPEGTEVPVRVPAPPKVLRKHGLGGTVCTILEVTGKTAEGHVLYAATPLAQATVRCSPRDQWNKAHGRWYALERALLQVTDDRLVRALRKTMYAATRWRPNGRDGYAIGFVHRVTGTGERLTKELVRVGG